MLPTPERRPGDHPPERTATAVTDTPHADLLARHRRVMPSWLALYYDEPIEPSRARAATSSTARHPLPRLLRRDPHHHDGLRRARGGRRHPHAGGPDDPHVDALPHPPDGRAGRAAGAAVGHPRRQGLLHHVGHRGQRGRPAVASTARRSNQVLALRNSYHGRSFATVGITGNRGWSASSLTRSPSTTSTPATASPVPPVDPIPPTPPLPRSTTSAT